ncbi:MAG: ABC-type Na+ efflux pump, permease component [Candidatus Carbobacillus altaicus]|uniref:ABC-type Na+ efflux pump, permease component n=1 Tax=Candidatus Carbonibacillus altaicus TaxID=2163959 RepID=A0A2R6XY32_9BACL|nr:MAG: ABC-type Na+ efflux pump, permease component [Candidatus Carbobacillus altaicus]
MDGFWTALKLGFWTKVKSPAYWFSVIVIVLVFMLFFNMESIIKLLFGENRPTRIGIGGDPAVVAALLEASRSPSVQETLAQNRVELSESDAFAGTKAVEDGSLEAYVEVQSSPDGRLSGTVLTQTGKNVSITEKTSQTLKALGQVWAIQKLKLSPAEFAALMDSPQLSYRALDEKKDGEAAARAGAAVAMTYMLIYLLYFLILGAALTLVTELAKEKSSRFIELVLPSVSPTGYMWAKILALLGAFVVQYAAVGLILYGVSRQETMKLFDEVIDLTQLPLELVVYAALMFILGYLFYAAIAAAVGAMVTRIEDASTAFMPMTMLFVIAFILSISALKTPDAPFVRVLAWVPPFTPLLLFVRIALGNVSGWEIAGAIGLLVVTTTVLMWVAARIFRQTILTYEGLDWRRLWALFMGSHS